MEEHLSHASLINKLLIKLFKYNSTLKTNKQTNKQKITQNKKTKTT